MTLALLAGAWIAGLLAGLHVDAGMGPSVLLAVAALCLVGLLRTTRLPLWPGLLAAVLVGGLVRVEASGGPAALDIPRPQAAALRGSVATDPEISGRAVGFTLRVVEVDLGEGWTRDEGRVLVQARPLSELAKERESPYFRYGDLLEVEGRLQVPPTLGEFDYRKYLAAQGIGFVMPFPDRVALLEEGGGNAARAFLYEARRRISHELDEALPEPQASLAQGLLLGLRDRIPEDMAAEFRDTGTSHLLAISGLHVGTVLVVSTAAGAWALGRRRQVYLLLPLAAMWAYAPAQRAVPVGGAGCHHGQRVPVGHSGRQAKDHTARPGLRCRRHGREGPIRPEGRVVPAKLCRDDRNRCPFHIICHPGGSRRRAGTRARDRGGAARLDGAWLPSPWALPPRWPRCLS